MVEVTKWLAYEVVEIGPAFAWAIFARSSNPTHESQPWQVALSGTRTSKSEAKVWARMEAESVAGRIEALFARIYFESTKTALVDMTTPRSTTRPLNRQSSNSSGCSALVKRRCAVPSRTGSPNPFQACELLASQK